MKRSGQILLTLCLVLLVLPCASSLVEGPQAEKAAAAPPLPADTRLEAVRTAAELPSGMLHTPAKRRMRLQTPKECIREDRPVLIPLCESNGWPITSRSWTRTVYTACRLEDRAG
ncbi:MAG: hypothetical protein IJ507_03595 [Clostridia bacterium]|nr:hypothetical protein [Clostridia bacterium]